MLFRNLANQNVNVPFIIKLLKQLRLPVTTSEFDIQYEIKRILDQNNVEYEKEKVLAPRNRVDFFIYTGDNTGIIIEVKKGKPNRNLVIDQLERYAQFESVLAVILVCDNRVKVPEKINGKTCVSIGLNRLWGVSL
ncbi:hypothetical protein BHU72_14565 [Desulfuribacillus stibiiarsenatis]|uniref:Type I restriction enzyme R protein N-terminal domain-containing protein n=1 Tax=Desulfuribacillus stibiiarsenatis TaxID=1390249 RepID=A0A1E5L7C1_9FIRM|nr:hypothetical protein [Desulfuribacillus stibiiarsenatis]OEH86050.1 hypothetical protein BHU72_14565 [Desulfuribacillus stibiiarsenatis]